MNTLDALLADIVADPLEEMWWLVPIDDLQKNVVLSDAAMNVSGTIRNGIAQTVHGVPRVGAEGSERLPPKIHWRRTSPRG